MILNAENNEARGEEDSNAQFLPKEVDDATTDVVLCEESASVIQEIDVVVHPSILQPTEKSKNIKKIGKQQGASNKGGRANLGSAKDVEKFWHQLQHTWNT